MAEEIDKLQKSIEDLTTHLKSEGAKRLILPGAGPMEPAKPLWTPDSPVSQAGAPPRASDPSKLILPGSQKAAGKPLYLPEGKREDFDLHRAFASREKQKDAELPGMNRDFIMPAAPTPKRPEDKKQEDEKKKATAGFLGLNSSMLKFGAGLVGISSVMKGLSGTVEGNRLDYAFAHLGYELADALRGPIRFITRELEGFARVMHSMNSQGSGHHWFRPDDAPGTPQHHYFGPDDPGYKQHHWFGPDTEEGKEHHWFKPDDPGFRQHRLIGPDDPDANDPRFGHLPQAVRDRQIREGKIKPSGEKADDHLQPMLHVGFGDVAGLQQRMQQLVTENPAQAKGLSLMEKIAQWVYEIAHPGQGGGPFPDDTVKQDK